MNIRFGKNYITQHDYSYNVYWSSITLLGIKVTLDLSLIRKYSIAVLELQSTQVLLSTSLQSSAAGIAENITTHCELAWSGRTK